MPTRALRVMLLAAMGAMLIASLAVPRAFGGDGADLRGRVPRRALLHLGAYRVRAPHDPRLPRVVARLAHDGAAACAARGRGGPDGPPARPAGSPRSRSTTAGLVLRGVERLADRARALRGAPRAESSSSPSASRSSRSAWAPSRSRCGARSCGALLGVAVAAALWWAYFDVVAIVAERRLREAAARDQVLIARDSYTYLHLPMVAGIILFAIGVKRTLTTLHAHLPPCPRVALVAASRSTSSRSVRSSDAT